MEFKHEKVSAEAFLCAMSADFPGLCFDQEVNGSDLVEWISSNIQELKTNVRKNMEREATISVAERVRVRE